MIRKCIRTIDKLQWRSNNLVVTVWITTHKYCGQRAITVVFRGPTYMVEPKVSSTCLIEFHAPRGTWSHWPRCSGLWSVNVVIVIILFQLKLVLNDKTVQTGRKESPISTVRFVFRALKNLSEMEWMKWFWTFNFMQKQFQKMYLKIFKPFPVKVH